MLEQLPFENMFFLDIETVPASPGFEALSEVEQELWTKKSRMLKQQEGDTPATIYERAGIYAEFGKIICISFGIFREGKLRVKSIYGDNEKNLLLDFAKLLGDLRGNTLLCAHNGKEFDFPYIARRMLIMGIQLPKLLNLAGKKPWEIPHLDTMDLWKFGDYKHYTSLELMAHVFQIPTPKDDIDGSMVAGVFWKEGDLERIKTYCTKDVVTLAQLMRRFKGMDLLKESEILYV